MNAKGDDMPCPVDGSEYITVGENRICPKCAHIAGFKRIDIVKLLQENEKLRAEVEYYKKMWLQSTT